MKLFYNIRYTKEDSSYNPKLLSIGIVSETQSTFYLEHSENLKKASCKKDFVYYQNINEESKSMSFIPPRNTIFCSNDEDISLTLNHFLSRFEDVEFASLNTDPYSYLILNNLVCKYPSYLGFPYKCNILRMDYNISQDISKYLNLDGPPTKYEINSLLYKIGLDELPTGQYCEINSLLLADTYRMLYKNVNGFYIKMLMDYEL